MSLWPTVYSSHTACHQLQIIIFWFAVFFCASAVQFHKGIGQISTQEKSTSLLGDRSIVPNGLMIQADSCILFAVFIHSRIQKGNYFSMWGESIGNFWVVHHTLCVAFKKLLYLHIYIIHVYYYTILEVVAAFIPTRPHTQQLLQSRLSLLETFYILWTLVCHWGLHVTDGGEHMRTVVVNHARAVCSTLHLSKFVPRFFRFCTFQSESNVLQEHWLFLQLPEKTSGSTSLFAQI